MRFNLIEPSKMDNLDDYICILAVGIMTLNTMKEFHVKAVNLGILKEDHEIRANAMHWDLTRLVKSYADQAEALLEFLPDGFSVNDVMAKFAEQEIKATKKITRKPRVKADG